MHVPFFTKKYGNILRFSGQGVEKINDDIKKFIIQKQTNGMQRSMPYKSKKDRTFDIEICERDKRDYTKSTNEYWSDIIFK